MTRRIFRPMLSGSYRHFFVMLGLFILTVLSTRLSYTSIKKDHLRIKAAGEFKNHPYRVDPSSLRSPRTTILCARSSPTRITSNWGYIHCSAIKKLTILTVYIHHRDKERFLKTSAPFFPALNTDNKSMPSKYITIIILKINKEIKVCL